MTTAIVTIPETIYAPCVHLNGDSRQTLLDDLDSVHRALEVARDQLRIANPNGRNYYTGTVTIKQAIEQYMQRMRAIDAIQAGIAVEMAMIEADRQS